MIRLQDYTPEIYYKSSRDFQFIGRLYDLVLNYLKTNCDLIYNYPVSDNSNKELTELLALTLGFVPKYKYTTKQLRALCLALPYALKNKGNVQGIMNVCNALLRAEGIEQEAKYSLSDNNTHIDIIVSQDLSDVMIISDVLSYLLPAGMSFTIVKELLLSANPMTTEIYVKSNDVNIYRNGTESDNRVYNNNIFAGQAELENDNNIDSLTRDTVGIISNSVVYKPEE